MRGIGVFLFCAVVMGAGRRSACSFEWKREREQKVVSAIDVQRAVQPVREFDGFSGVAAMAGQKVAARWSGCLR